MNNFLIWNVFHPPPHSKKQTERKKFIPLILKPFWELKTMLWKRKPSERGFGEFMSRWKGERECKNVYIVENEWSCLDIVCSWGWQGLWRYCLHRWIKYTMDGHSKWFHKSLRFTLCMKLCWTIYQSAGWEWDRVMMGKVLLYENWYDDMAELRSENGTWCRF